MQEAKRFPTLKICARPSLSLLLVLTLARSIMPEIARCDSLSVMLRDEFSMLSDDKEQGKQVLKGEWEEMDDLGGSQLRQNSKHIVQEGKFTDMIEPHLRARIQRAVSVHDDAGFIEVPAECGPLERAARCVFTRSGCCAGTNLR